MPLRDNGNLIHMAFLPLPNIGVKLQGWIGGLSGRLLLSSCFAYSLRLTRLDHPSQGLSMIHTPHPDLWLREDPDPAPSNRHVGFPLVQCAPIGNRTVVGLAEALCPDS